MASSYDFFLTGDHEAAKGVIASGLQTQRFAVETSPKGGFIATRGNATKTALLGAMAGKDFRVSLIVEFFVDASGNLVARLNRNVGGGLVRGGAIGANMANNAFVDTSKALTEAATSAGILASSVVNP